MNIAQHILKNKTIKIIADDNTVVNYQTLKDLVSNNSQVLCQNNIKKKLELDINKGVRKIDAFTANFKVSYEEWDIKKYDPFFNINNREDLNIAKKLIIIND